MSEQTNQVSNSQVSEVEEDPLAELARIVAGEPDLNSSAQEEAPQPEPELPQVSDIASEPEQDMMAALEEQLSSPEAEPVIEAANEPVDMTEVTSLESPVEAFQPEIAEVPIEETVVAQDIVPEDNLDAVDVEAALEEQLMAEFGREEATDNLETPDFVNDINTSISEINAQEDIAPSTVAEEPVANEFAEDPDAGFQDGLISALEMEITGEPQVEAVAATDTEVIAPVEVADDSIENVSVEQANDAPLLDSADLQTSLEEELAMQMAGETAQVVEPLAENITAATSLEDDLGAAFAQELEQISAPTEVTATVESVASDPSLEMDFEAAFAEEMQEAGVSDEVQGWSENATLEANTDFVASAIGPGATAAEPLSSADDLSILENDPGHVGSIDEISSVETDTTAANDNGGGMKLAVAAFILALFAGAIAAGYGFLGGENSTIASGTPEIIKADADPVKVKPKDPGGLVPENQDNASYSDLGGENTAVVSQQTLNSQTEEPLVLNQGNAVDIAKSDDRLAPSDDVGATATNADSAVQPKVVQTVVVKPDGTIIRKPVAPKPVETASNTVTINQPAIVEAEPIVNQQVSTLTGGIDGAQTTGDIKVPSLSPVPKPAVQPKPAPVKKVAAKPKPQPKPKKAAPAPARKSEWVVQVSSQRSPEAAQASFVDMRNRYSALRGRAMSIQRANVNGATYYRVRIQTASKSDANQLCSRLSSAGGNCFVTR